MPKKISHSHDVRSTTVTLRGRVRAFNLSPKGAVEGALIETEDGLAQINLEKGQSPSPAWKEGAALEVRAIAEPSHGKHDVYKLAGEDDQVSGRVERVNYARHAEPNGFVLDDGTFVHLKPEGAKRFQAINVGDRVRARGRVTVGDHARVVDTDHVERA